MIASMTTYDEIGTGYADGRRTDPRIERVVHAALGDAERVINVGAGTGSYEPHDRIVVAVEPSLLMLRQRSRNAAPAVRAVAECLPFEDNTFDAAMATLTVHHWTDRARGYREIRRVARRVVVLAYDPDVHEQQWIVRDYVPQVGELDRQRGLTLEELIDALDATVVLPVLIPADCTDGFLMAYWRRPEAFLDPKVQQANSGFVLSDRRAVEAGLRRLDEDLRSGRWHEKYGGLLELEAFDAGLRLVVAGEPVGNT